MHRNHRTTINVLKLQMSHFHQRRDNYTKACGITKLTQCRNHASYWDVAEEHISISIRESETDGYVELIEWCSVNTTGKWHTHESEFCFVNEVDAAMFKLLFG